MGTISIKTASDGLSGSLDWNGTPIVTVDGSGVTVPVATTSTQPVQLSQCPITKEYLSTGQTITSAGLLTLAHGLGAKPKIVSTYLKCTTADNGYSIGDEVQCDVTQESGSTADSYGTAIYCDATNINVRYGSAASTFIVLNKTTGAGVLATNANWQLYVSAWA